VLHSIIIIEIVLSFFPSWKKSAVSGKFGDLQC
jgi:hypothetical protein